MSSLLCCSRVSPWIQSTPLSCMRFHGGNKNFFKVTFFGEKYLFVITCPISNICKVTVFIKPLCNPMTLLYTRRNSIVIFSCNCNKATFESYLEFFSYGQPSSSAIYRPHNSRLYYLTHSSSPFVMIGLVKRFITHIRQMNTRLSDDPFWCSQLSSQLTNMLSQIENQTLTNRSMSN